MNTESTARRRSPDRQGAKRRACARLLIAIATLLFVGCADAQTLYSCTTPDGRRIDSDQIPPECYGRRIHQHRRDGTPLPDILPDPTPEERKKQEEERKRKLAEEDAKLEQRRKDKSLLETYSNVDEIEAHRKRDLASQQAVIDRAKARKEELKKERVNLSNEAEFYEKRDMPEHLKRAFAANNESVKLQDKAIQNANAEMQRVNARFDAFVKRFKELIEQGATPVRRPTPK